MPEDTQPHGATPDAAPGQTPTENKQPAAQPDAGSKQEVSSLPDWAQTLIHALRDENAQRRKTADKQEADAKAAEEQRLADEKKWQELAEKRGTEMAGLKTKADAYDTLQAQLLTKAQSEVAKWPEEVKALLPDGTQAENAAAYIAAVEKARPLVAKMQQEPKGGNPGNPKGASSTEVVQQAVRTENAHFVGSRF